PTRARPRPHAPRPPRLRVTFPSWPSRWCSRCSSLVPLAVDVVVRIRVVVRVVILFRFVFVFVFVLVVLTAIVVADRTELAIAPLIADGELAEDVLERLGVSMELQEDPSLVGDETEDLRAKVVPVLTGELVGVRALVGGELVHLLHACKLVQ